MKRAKTRRRIVRGNKVLVDPIHHARAATLRRRFRGWFRHGLRIERYTYEGEESFSGRSFSLPCVTECGRAVREEGFINADIQPGSSRRGSRASRPLEITPRPCHINYRDSFRPHLQWANLAWGNLGAIPCARARTWRLSELYQAINRGRNNRSPLCAEIAPIKLNTLWNLHLILFFFA